MEQEYFWWGCPRCGNLAKTPTNARTANIQEVCTCALPDQVNQMEYIGVGQNIVLAKKSEGGE